MGPGCPRQEKPVPARSGPAELGGSGRELAEHTLLGKQIRNVISCVHAAFPGMGALPLRGKTEGIGLF